MTEDTSYSLFSKDEMDAVEASQFPSFSKGPVTVLGITFNSDEERRAFFREELRKRLPELKTIEGYPIAEDEDVIALSDPPYYTACPNPWINDVITEWESAKSRLESKGKRLSDYEVQEPYASDISEGKNNKIYNAHSYHTKVPHPAIMRYILHYTQPGDIVYDGFAGTGMTGVAAQMCGAPDSETKQMIEREWKETKGFYPKWGIRNSICGDLSPVASFIAYNYNLPVAIQDFKNSVNRILEQVEKECGWMYKTKNSQGALCRINYVIWSDVFECPNCGHEIVFYDAAVDMDNQQILSSFPCPHCGTYHTKNDLTRVPVTTFDETTGQTVVTGKSLPVLIEYTDADGHRKEKKPDDYDMSILDKIENMRIPEWFPTDLMMGVGEKWGDTWRAGYHFGISRVHHFYTKRALAAYAAMRDRFSNQQLWILTSILEGGSKLNRERPFGLPSKLSGTLYVASTIREIDVIGFAKRKVNRYVDAWYNREIGHALVNICSATNSRIPSDSIDYIFTDPPFGGNLMYSELNFIQEAWLKVKTNNKEEAIVNDNQNKSIFDYQRLMTDSIREYYRVLKPGKWITIEFSNTSAAVWNSIQNALQSVGFVVANVAALDKKQGSFKAVTTTTAVKQDLVITCFKPTDAFVKKLESGVDIEGYVWSFVDEYLQHLPVHIERNNSTTAIIERSPKILFDRLITYYVQRGLPVPISATEFQNGLRERYEEEDGMFFTPSQLAEYREKKKDAPEFVPMGLIVSNEADGIEWLRNHLRDNPQTYQDIQPDWMQAINGLRKGDILPELNELLEENFIQESDGSWRLPNIQDDVDKDKLRTKALLKEFKIYVDAASKPKSKIKEVRVEAIRAGFKQCYMDKDFKTIVIVGDKIPQNLLTEDEILLQFYDIALSHV